MLRHRTCAFLLAVVVLAVAVALWPAPAVSQPPAKEDTLPRPIRLLAYRGAGSCAAAACHGNNDGRSTRGCEYTLWMAHDKHVRAYEVLLSERSRIMERNYRQLPDLKKARPERDRLCLRCHSLDADAALAGQAVATVDGVGCERCHGPAERWLALHYQRPWATKSNKEKEALGFRPTKDLKARALLCVECHVGSAEAEVDHDLIAAGHPRLNFENGAYLATMPPHWDVRAETARRPDLQARLWAVGQVASAKAALELLAFRADEKNDKPWPEFAEYDCYACHHNLTGKSWRLKRGYGDRAPGVLPWNDWYTSMLRLPANAPVTTEAGVKALDGLTLEMNKPLPDRAKVAEQARAAAQVFTKRLKSLDRDSWDAAAVRGWLDRLLQEDPSAVSGNWDRATQYYLELAALHHGLTDLNPGARDAALVRRLQRMGRDLRFAPNTDSPRDLAPPLLTLPPK